MQKLNYKHTVFSCFLGFICQSVTINFAPLLFLTFSSQFNIPLSSITAIITVNFSFQLLTDLISPRFVDKIGYRRAMILAHALCASGLILLPLLPKLLGGFPGLLVATLFYAIGGGLIEVLASPIIESCPMNNKSGLISLLHSFYCWGILITVLLSTAFFELFGINNWEILAVIWAIIPISNIVLVCFAPMPSPPPVEKGKTDLKTVFSKGIFWIFLAMMIAAGSAEMAVQQWASTFTELALGVDKTLGDLIGVCGYAVMMGTVRIIYSKFADRIPKKPALLICGILTLLCYFAISLSSSPVIGFIGCVFCGFSLGILWPCTFSLATSKLQGFTTSMFALLSLAGDVGCTLGPTTTGLIAEAAGGDLKIGILAASVFPILFIICILFLARKDKKER